MLSYLFFNNRSQKEQKSNLFKGKFNASWSDSVFNCVLLDFSKKVEFCLKKFVVGSASTFEVQSIFLHLRKYLHILLLGCFIRFSCSLIKWWSQLTKNNDIPQDPIHPPLLLDERTDKINEVHISKLNWRQNNFPYQYIYITMLYMIFFRIDKKWTPQKNVYFKKNMVWSNKSPTTSSASRGL